MYSIQHPVWTKVVCPHNATTPTLGASKDSNSFVPVVTYVDQNAVSAAAKVATELIVETASSPNGIVLGPIESELAVSHGRRSDTGIAIVQQGAHPIVTTGNEREIRAAQRAAKKASREERKKQVEEGRKRKEMLAEQLKEKAMKRAADLVVSNLIPIEITRGIATKKQKTGPPPPPYMAYMKPGSDRKPRSPIVVTTAGDLHRIVTLADNLWKKYSDIAKEHNQKVHWQTVSKELGIHVKVREKYNRMYLRAKRKGFDFIKNAHYKIRDHQDVRIVLQICHIFRF